mmetsp:Transcript_59830/g.129636  ORF Transcript_59830/g.129636 Transcript_59830/m.129636 type:complete len:229 (-) Transcript_59830:147-833(-)
MASGLPLAAPASTLDLPPPQWVGPGEPPADHGAIPGASTAGCPVASPATTKMKWDWELRKSAERVRPPLSTESAADITCAESGVAAGSSTTHSGGCHCGAVRFRVDAPSSLVVWDCNCSDCRMRANTHFIVPKSALRLVIDDAGGKDGASALTEYRWGTGVARHFFCARCGISPLYVPRSNPDGWAVTFQCLDPGTVTEVEVRHFDGQNWEDCYAGKGSSITSFSAPD